jgi:hypothetical protein
VSREVLYKPTLSDTGLSDYKDSAVFNPEVPRIAVKIGCRHAGFFSHGGLRFARLPDRLKKRMVALFSMV